MRFLAILVFLLVAWSVAVPKQVFMPETNHSCCHADLKKNHTPERKKHSCCDDGGCNPFQACACCGFILRRPWTLPEIPEAEKKSEKIFLHNTAVVSLFVSSCFHPPEALSC